MKKVISFALSAIIILTLASCGNPNPPENSNKSSSTQAPTPVPDSSEESVSESKAPDTPPQENVENSGTNILIAYFSVPEDVIIDGVDAISGASVVVVDGDKLGNVQYIAQIIQENSGGDLFRIETVQQYPLDHDPLLDFAKKEQDQDARPELSAHVDNIDDYDVIFLGFPNWWADLPQPLYTFLEEYDLSGKTIIPFCPHGGSGFSRTISTIADMQPGAAIDKDGFTVSRNNVKSAESDVVAWIKELGYYNDGSTVDSSPK